MYARMIARDFARNRVATAILVAPGDVSRIYLTKYASLAVIAT